MNSDLYSLLIERMGGGSVAAGDGAPGQSLQELLAQMGETDQRAALLASNFGLGALAR